MQQPKHTAKTTQAHAAPTPDYTHTNVFTITGSLLAIAFICAVPILAWKVLRSILAPRRVVIVRKER